MARLLPFRTEPEANREPRLVNIDDEDTADEVFAALSSDTARRILSRLYEDPTTASELADAVDTSLQNARYHLDKLQAAGLVEAVDTWYSSRGTEMTVYAPTNDPLVVTAGREEHATILRDAVKRLVGAVGLLGLASLVVDRIARRFGPSPRRVTLRSAAGDGVAEADRAVSNATGTPTPTPPPEPTTTEATVAAGGARASNATAAPSPTPEPTLTPTPTASPTPTSEPLTIQNVADTATPAAADGGSFGAIGAALPPGVLFFAGGLLVLVLVSAWWYWAGYRRRIA